MRTEELRGLSPEELNKQLEAAHKELFELRFKLSTRQLVNHQLLGKAKKEIARFKTVIRERELGIR